jgi:hypothetical protein
VTRPHEYVECDVPEGMTLREYHAQQRAARKRPRRSVLARLRRRRDRRRAAQRA